jgi:phage-related holin
MGYLNKLLIFYGYDSVQALLESIFPSTKYVSVGQSLALSSVWGVFCSALGIWPILALAMVLAMAIELVSGIVASHKRQEKFESAKFSRFVLKLCIWFVLFVSCQLFEFFAEQYGHNAFAWIIGAWFFDVLTVILMIAFVVEYTTSILENMACIDGKDKSFYIDAVKRVAQVAVDRLMNKQK